MRRAFTASVLALWVCSFLLNAMFWGIDYSKSGHGSGADKILTHISVGAIVILTFMLVAETDRPARTVISYKLEGERRDG